MWGKMVMCVVRERSHDLSSETLNLELKEGLSLVFPVNYPIALGEMYVLAAFFVCRARW